MSNVYLCGECGESMTCVEGMIHYDECGLDNVVLLKVPVWQCANGHKDVQIPAVDGLHELLAQMLVTQRWPLRGQEMRFLRKFFGYSARAFSAIIGINYVTLSKFENERKRIPRKMDALVRLFCAQSLCERKQKSFPRPLIRVLEQLESEQLDLRSDLRVEHLSMSSARAASVPEDVWKEAGA